MKGNIMDRYTKQAVKITIPIFLCIFGFFGLIGLVKADPPSPYDFGVKQQIIHISWGYELWRLQCNLAVNYDATESWIYSWTITGSGATAPGPQWETWAYSSTIIPSTAIQGKYSYVKHMNEARFKSTDIWKHKGKADAYVYIYAAEEHEAGATWEQETIWFLWIETKTSLW